MADFLQVTSFDPLVVEGEQGDPGAAGATGATPNLQIGTVTTVSPSTPASASITGTVPNPLLNLSIPQGAAGTGAGGGAVTSVNTQTGAVVLTAASVGADASGAASTAQTAAQTYADTNKLAKSSNLSDVANPATSRTNLGLGTAAIANKVAAGTAGVLDATDATTTNARTPTGTAGGDLAGTYPNPTLATTAVTPGAYTNANVTVDSKGRITAAANGTGGGSGITALTGDVTASGTGSVTATVVKVNGTSLAGLATGLLKNTTGTGVPSIATASDIPSLDAAKITTGVLAIGRLATGTPDGTKFVRDDGTLAVPPGTGGGGSVTSVFTRTGAVVAASGDYTGAQVTSVPATTGLSSTNVDAALAELNADRASDQTATVAAARSGMVLATRQVIAGTGMSGGGDLSADRTLTLANTAVTPGSYTATNLTVDAQGRITAASNGSGGSGEAALAPTAVKTAGYTAAVADFVPVDCTSAGVTITLPTAPADKTRIGVKKIDTSANAVTIARGGSDVFNKAAGSTSLSLTLQFQSVVLEYNASGAIWYVLASDRPVSDLLAKASNLSDVASVSTARTNLGLVAVASSGSATDLSAGTLPAGRMPALTGDITTSTGAVATTLASTAVSAGSYTNANITVDAKGRLTAASNGSGGSGVDAWSAFMSLVATPVANTGTAWAPTQASATYFSGVNVNGAGAINDTATWVTTLSAGTWQVDFFGRSQAGAGIATIEFSTNGGSTWTSVGTWDLYTSANTVASKTVTGITVGTSGRTLVRFTALSKNASSTSYQMPLGAAQWQRTA